MIPSPASYLGVLLLVLLVGAGAASAQGPAVAGADPRAADPPEPDEPDPPWVDFDFLRFGGGSSVGGQLEIDAESRRPLLRVPWLDDRLARYEEWKRSVAKRIGLSFGTDYTTLYQVATQSPGSNEGASGTWRAFGRWDLWGRDSDSTGSLVFRGETRHGFGAGQTPARLGREIGSVLPTAVGYNDQGWLLNTLYWVQRIKGRATIMAGQLDPSDWVDPSGLLNRQTSFLNAAFGAANPTIATPAAGLGAGLGLFFGPFYAAAVFTDANGDPTRPFVDAFSEGEFFKVLQLGFFSRFERRTLDNIHVMGWHVDEREQARVPAGWGVSASATWFFGGRWAPFLRVGYSNGGAARLEGLVAGGLGVQLRGGDLLGVGLSWARPGERGLDDQYGAEIFYRLQLVGNLAITPDVQLIIDPALGASTSVIAVFGFRARLAF